MVLGQFPPVIGVADADGQTASDSPLQLNGQTHYISQQWAMRGGEADELGTSQRRLNAQKWRKMRGNESGITGKWLQSSSDEDRYTRTVYCSGHCLSSGMASLAAESVSAPLERTLRMPNAGSNEVMERNKTKK